MDKQQIGERFADLLKQLKFPSTKRLNLNWAFEYVRTRPFLEWLLENISDKNLISSEELKQFHYLEERNLLLKESSLETAIQHYQESAENDEELRKKIADEEKESQNLKKLLNHRILQREALHSHLLNISNKDSSYRSLITHEKSDYYDHKIRSATNTLKKTLDETSKCIKELIELHPDASINGINFAFISKQDISKYLEQDEIYVKLLGDFFKSEFNPRVLKGVQPKSAYKFLDIDTDEIVFVDEEKQKDYERKCRHIKQLQSDFFQSYMQLIETKILEISLNTAISTSNIQDKNENKYKMIDENQIKSQIERIREEKSIIISRIKNAMNEEIPKLLESVSKYQTSAILQSDYLDQIEKQDLILCKQNSLLELILDQQFIHIIMIEALEGEMLFHKKSKDIIYRITEILNNYSLNIESRILKYNSIYNSVKEKKQSLNISFDDDEHNLFKSIFISDCVDNTRKFITWDKLINTTRELKSQLESNLSEYNLNRTSKEQLQSKLKNRLDTLCDIVYLDKEFSLSSFETSQAISELKNSLSSLTEKLDNLMKEFTFEQEKMMRNPEEAVLKRELLYNFFISPNIIEKNFNSLSSRVDATRTPNQ